MKKIFYLILILCLCVVGAMAQQSPDKILKRAVKALGGEQSLRAVRATQAKGQITRQSDNGTGQFLLETNAPNLYLTRFDVGGAETTAAYNGKSAWQRDGNVGLRTLTGASGRGLQALANFRNNRWLDYKREKAKISNAGTADINNQIADIVRLTTAKGVTLKLFFDRASGLPVREEISAGEGAAQQFDYTDFRLVDNVQEPFAIRLTANSETYNIALTQIQHNAQIARADFDFPRVSSEPLPDIAQLLRQVQANEDKVDLLLENYTYTQTETARELQSDGTLRDKESRTEQVTHYKGVEIRRVIAKNGKPLNQNEQEKEDARAAKRIEEIDKTLEKRQEKRVKQASSGQPSDEGGDRISIAEILRASNLVNPRREQFRGRDVVVFDFEPNPNFNYSNAKSFLKFFGKTAGAIWIDEADKQVARIEAVLSDNFKVGGGFVANLKKGASFTLEQARFNNEIWLPASADINLSVKVLLVKGFNINAAIRYGEYQKFNTQVKDAKVDDLQKP